MLLEASRVTTCARTQLLPPPAVPSSMTDLPLSSSAIHAAAVSCRSIPARLIRSAFMPLRLTGNSTAGQGIRKLNRLYLDEVESRDHGDRRGTSPQ